jgi:hypothetical protein
MIVLFPPNVTNDAPTVSAPVTETKTATLDGHVNAMLDGVGIFVTRKKIIAPTNVLTMEPATTVLAPVSLAGKETIAQPRPSLSLREDAQGTVIVAHMVCAISMV